MFPIHFGAILEPLIPAPKTGGRRRTVNMREIINTIFYILASGCAGATNAS